MVDKLAFGRFVRGDISWYVRATRDQDDQGQVVARNRALAALIGALHLHTPKYVAKVLTSGIPMNSYTISAYVSDIDEFFTRVKPFYFCHTSSGIDADTLREFRNEIATCLNEVETRYHTLKAEGRITEEAA